MPGRCAGRHLPHRPSRNRELGVGLPTRAHSPEQAESPLREPLCLVPWRVEAHLLLLQERQSSSARPAHVIVDPHARCVRGMCSDPPSCASCLPSHRGGSAARASSTSVPRGLSTRRTGRPSVKGRLLNTHTRRTYGDLQYSVPYTTHSPHTLAAHTAGTHTSLMIHSSVRPSHKGQAYLRGVRPQEKVGRTMVLGFFRATTQWLARLPSDDCLTDAPARRTAGGILVALCKNVRKSRASLRAFCACSQNHRRVPLASAWSLTGPSFIFRSFSRPREGRGVLATRSLLYFIASAAYGLAASPPDSTEVVEGGLSRSLAPPPARARYERPRPAANEGCALTAPRPKTPAGAARRGPRIGASAFLRTAKPRVAGGP